MIPESHHPLLSHRLQDNDRQAYRYRHRPFESAHLRYLYCRNVCGNQCGLRFHDKDASHCKSCGHVIYQEYEG
ncbi:MAG: hypothetical protein DRQ39_10890 [Gammaproteobacteria bacterium]|nr:MAG: hypothetical protein DRQ39_10890 [Gammaproteobacteria bacterium]